MKYDPKGPVNWLDLNLNKVTLYEGVFSVKSNFTSTHGYVIIHPLFTVTVRRNGDDEDPLKSHVNFVEFKVSVLKLYTEPDSK